MRPGFLVVLVLLTAGCRTTHPACAIPPSPSASHKVPACPLPGEVLAQDLSFDAVTGTIQYTLPEPALVRIRIGLRDGGPLVNTLVDWEEQQQGRHTLVWDKKDASGLVDLSFRNDFMAVVSCLSLDARRRTRYDGPVRGFRKSPDVIITFPEAPLNNGVPVVNGFALLRIQVAEKDKQWLSESKFEVSVFVDTIFLMEDEEGTSPFNYRINTGGLADGVHSITVNLIGYNGEIGTASATFQVDKTRLN